MSKTHSVAFATADRIVQLWKLDGEGIAFTSVYASEFEKTLPIKLAFNSGGDLYAFSLTDGYL